MRRNGYTIAAGILACAISAFAYVSQAEAGWLRRLIAHGRAVERGTASRVRSEIVNEAARESTRLVIRRSSRTPSIDEEDDIQR